MNKVAVLFGVTGQVGSYMLDLLLDKGYIVIGAARRVSLPNTSRIEKHLGSPHFILNSCDITDAFSVYRFLDSIFATHTFPIEIYNFAAQSYVAESFIAPGLTWDITAKGHLNILESLKELEKKYCNKARLFFMGSSEQFGSIIDGDGFQRETTPMIPNSPYATAKLAAFNLGKIYRKSYGMDVRNGIIFNTESPRRGPEFVTRKITRWFADYYNDASPFNKLKLGNIESQRDWTHCKDTVEAIHLIMQDSEPDDYVISSGISHSVLDFMKVCYNFDCCGNRPLLGDLYEIDPTLYRPCEVPYLKGDSTKLRLKLRWNPKICFEDLVEDMLASDFVNTRAKMGKYG